MAGEVIHRMVRTNGIQMHIAEQGKEGPLILLIHGFPELWYSWRKQIPELANHGYHVVAPDLRGYGDTDSPADPDSYTCFHIVGDLIGLLDALGEQKAFVVGHDWGALIAWYLCLFRPDRVRALVNLSVPFYPRPATVKPVENFRQHFGEGFYVCQFQEPGRTERSFARHDCSLVMKKFLLINKPDLLIAPPGMDLIDSLETPPSFPEWLTEEELHYFADKFRKTGFTGALNYYRSMDRNWELMAPWQGAKILVPTKLIVGDKDIGFDLYKIRDYVTGEGIRNAVPGIETVIIDGHHFIQQEKAQRVTEEILSFFGSFV
ncbi:hypothetical protein H6P81_004811 [Aristolochia fimbriata]|uniref:soluble epoxide hydrolase n=1 Tax=Aristolochia fimbriata TaxID=158543 RepID=A0AAV7EWA2_ARIFI|nr:hypothetical protein H6P81_004811 [Aristolochia fimbriata]